MLEGEKKKNLPKCQNPVSGSLLLQGPSGAKPSLLIAWPEAPRVARCPCSRQHWRGRQQGHLCQMVDTLSSGLETLDSNGKWPETTQGQHWYFKRLGDWRGRRNHLFKRKKETLDCQSLEGFCWTQALLVWRKTKNCIHAPFSEVLQAHQHGPLEGLRWGVGAFLLPFLW